MARHARRSARFRGPAGFVLAAALAALLAGCNLHYSRGVSLEAQNRWEEAAIEYRLAYLDDPDDPEYAEALERANKAVAQENLELYRRYLAQKEFRKAYLRLVDASRQDPDLEPAAEEMKKWLRVLVAGQVQFAFEALRTNLSLADEIELTVRINTPNPAEVIETEINVDTGTFFVEHLLYDLPHQALTLYSLNAIGVNLSFARSRTRRFSSRSFQSFVNFRVPVVDDVRGGLDVPADGALKTVLEHRRSLNGGGVSGDYWKPAANPHYRLELEGRRILVSGGEGRYPFTPRLLYLNNRDRRLFVDFGRYEVRSEDGSGQWQIARLPLAENDYFPAFSRNVALEPYFFYREGVYRYASSGQP